MLAVVRCRQVRGAGNSLQGSSVDENLPISGRSPQFFCHGSSGGCRLRGRARASEPSSPARAIEMRVRVGRGGNVGRTRCRTLRRIRHRHARPCPHKPDSHVCGNASTNSAKASGQHQGRMSKGHKTYSDVQWHPLPKRARCHPRMQRQIPPDRLEAAARTAHEQSLISKQQYHTLKKELRGDNGH